MRSHRRSRKYQPLLLLLQFRSLQMVPASAEGLAAEAAATVVKPRSVTGHLPQARWDTLFTVARRAATSTEQKAAGTVQLARIVTSAGLPKDPRTILCSASRRASTTSGPRAAGRDPLASVAISALGHGRQIQRCNQMDLSRREPANKAFRKPAPKRCNMCHVYFVTHKSNFRYFCRLGLFRGCPKPRYFWRWFAAFV